MLFLATDAQGKWLVTGDSGPENIIIIWDSSDLFPQKTLFSPHGSSKLAKISLSEDAKYLMTLAYTDSAVLHWWIWSFGLDVPHGKKGAYPSFRRTQICVCFTCMHLLYLLSDALQL